MQVEIQDINFQGDGYGILNGKKVFIPKTCCGDLVKFEIIRENKDFIVGRLLKLLRKSCQRAEKVPCPVYDVCGGCNLMHLKDEAYYGFKKSIIKNALRKAGYEFNDINLIKIGYNTRRRASFQVKNGKVGFFEKNSNIIVDIRNCPLIVDSINSIIPDLKDVSRRIPTTEVFLTDHENGLEVIFNLKRDLNFDEMNLLRQFTELSKKVIVVSYTINNGEDFLFIQKETPLLTLDSKIKIELIPHVFLQATLAGQRAITDIVVANLQNSKNILDLYCGIGTYTFPLSNYAHVHSVEGNRSMINNLDRNILANRLTNKITTECRNLVSSPLLKNELDKYDGIVINPPRNGAEAQCKHIAESNIKKVVMVSCNPQTFASDASRLRIGSFNLTSINGIDQFYRTQHMEIVGIFERA